MNLKLKERMAGFVIGAALGLVGYPLIMLVGGVLLMLATGVNYMTMLHLSWEYHIPMYIGAISGMFMFTFGSN